jgi:hypothetical protein
MSPTALWLQNRLSAATECWKMVFLHHAPYSSSNNHGSTTAIQWPYEAWGASAVFAGHDHTYERLQIGGIPYFVNGAGGGALYGFQAFPVTGSQVRYSAEHGAMRIQMDGSSMTTEFIDTNGLVVDTFTASCPPVNATTTPTVEDSRCPLKLSDPYPNPALTEDSLRLDMITNPSCAQHLRVAVFTPANRIIREEALIFTGRHTWVWDMRDSNRRDLANGLFYIRVEDAERTGIRKCLPVVIQR